MIDDCNITNLAKNQASAVLNWRAIRRSVPSKFIEICMVLIQIGTNMAAGNIRHWVLLQKRKFISLEELKNINIILFLIQEPVQIVKFPEISPEISHFLTNSAVM